MKYFYFSFLLTLCSLNSFSQNIINVNNTSAASETDLTTLQEAITAAVDGDVIYLSPSSISYGNATIDKQVTIFGPGYWVANNPDLEISTYTGNAVIGDLTITALGSGSYLSGCDFNYIAADGVANFYISRNRVRNRIYLKNTSHVVVEGNYFDFISSANGSPTDENWLNLSANTNNSSLLVRNNIFIAYNYYSKSCGLHSTNRRYDNINIGATSNALVENNIFRDRCYFNNSVVKNNIFLMTDQYNNCDTPIVYNGITTVLKNNVLVKNQGGLDPSNMVGVSSDIFVGYPTQGSRSFDDRWELIENSPAEGFGIGGVDCGVFDGVAPYKLSGIPIIPVVYELTGSSQGTSASGIDINVKVRSNN